MTTRTIIARVETVNPIIKAKKRAVLQLSLIYALTLVVYLLTIVASFSQSHEIIF